MTLALTEAGDVVAALAAADCGLAKVRRADGASEWLYGPLTPLPIHEADEPVAGAGLVALPLPAAAQSVHVDATAGAGVLAVLRDGGDPKPLWRPGDGQPAARLEFHTAVAGSGARQLLFLVRDTTLRVHCSPAAEAEPLALGTPVRLSLGERSWHLFTAEWPEDPPGQYLRIHVQAVGDDARYCRVYMSNDLRVTDPEGERWPWRLSSREQAVDLPPWDPRASESRVLLVAVEGLFADTSCEVLVGAHAGPGVAVVPPGSSASGAAGADTLDFVVPIDPRDVELCSVYRLRVRPRSAGLVLSERSLWPRRGHYSWRTEGDGFDAFAAADDWAGRPLALYGAVLREADNEPHPFDTAREQLLGVPVGVAVGAAALAMSSSSSVGMEASVGEEDDDDGRLSITVTVERPTDALSEPAAEAARRINAVVGALEAEHEEAMSFRPRRAQQGQTGMSAGTLTYGEVDALSFAATLAGLGLGGVFMDLGSGMGKAVFAAAATGCFRECVGIEVQESLDGIARRLLPALGPQNCSFLRGSFLDVHSHWVDADVVFASCLCFDYPVLEGISALAMAMRPEARLLVIRLWEELEAAFEVERELSVRMSWGRSPLYVMRRRLRG